MLLLRQGRLRQHRRRHSRFLLCRKDLVWSGCPRLARSQSKPLLHELLLRVPLLLLVPLLLQLQLCLNLQLVWSACTLRLWLPFEKRLLGSLWGGPQQGLRLHLHPRWCIRWGLRRGLRQCLWRRLHLHLRWCASLGERLRLHWWQHLLLLRLGAVMRWLGLRRQYWWRRLLLPKVCWWQLLPLLVMVHAPALPGLWRRGWELPHWLLLVGLQPLLRAHWRLPVLLLWQKRWRRRRLCW
jgi:hypothetical protein